MKKPILLISILIIVQLAGLKAVDFSTKERSVIYTNAIRVLQDYQNILNDIGTSAVTDIEKAKGSSESFLELFVNRQVLLFNDLDPSHKLSEFYEAETYISNIILWYPDGITISLDLGNALVGEIMQHEENVYSIDLLVKKSINGNYLNETMNKNTEELTFRIAFGIENKDMTNFRIVGIRSAASTVVVDYSQALKEVNSEDLNVDELNQIYSEIKTVLQDYTNFLALLGDPQELPEDKEFYKTSFINLFQSTDIKLYNDLMPDPEINLVSINDYLDSYAINFPYGIKNLKINTDSARFGKVMKADDDSYYTFVDANKFFSGNYRGREVFSEMFPLIFRINFTKAGRTFTNFRITSVDIASVNFYEDTPDGVLEKKPSMAIQPVTRKGLVISFVGSFGQTKIINNNIESLTLESDDHEWQTTPDYGYLGSVGISYYFNDNISVRSGFEFSKYSTSYSLDGIFTDSTNYYTDPNNELFNKTIEAAYDSLVNINLLTIPVLLSYTSGKPGKFGFYAEAGPKISVSLKTTYTNTGVYNYMGYFEADPFEPRYRTAPEWGFYTRENIDDTDKAKTNLLSMSFYASAGINIPLGYYTSIMVGPEINIGITDILDSSLPYTDIFGNNLDHQSTKILYFGAKISFNYKL